MTRAGLSVMVCRTRTHVPRPDSKAVVVADGFAAKSPEMAEKPNVANLATFLLNLATPPSPKFNFNKDIAHGVCVWSHARAHMRHTHTPTYNIEIKLNYPTGPHITP